MKRTAYNKLLEWQNSSARKPLIIKGARQVGKTWLMKEFGKNEFKSVAYINFERSTELANLFEIDFDVQRIINSIQIITGVKPIAGETLIIFDEIQTVRRGLLSLKYFHEDSPKYHIIAAGSLLGLSVHKEDSFPVGKVEFLDLHPLSYEEFVSAMGQQILIDTLHDKDWLLITTFKNKYIELLKQYYYIGGMPEVVAAFIDNNDYKQVRKIQLSILESYDKDFSKHPPIELLPRIKMVWNSIASQLAKENKKFIYGALKSGARAKDFELAIAWLLDAGVIYKVARVNNASLPLCGFEELGAFKLYIVDIGLLSAISGLDIHTIVEKNTIFNQYKGALTEQFVLQQLKGIEDMHIFYWATNAGTAEIDFLVQYKGQAIPIEVKAEENLKAKSLKSFIEKYNPPLSIRTSMSDYREESSLTNIPLYAISSSAIRCGSARAVVDEPRLGI